MSDWIIVTNLPSHITSRGLRELFEHIGNIKAVYIKLNQSTSSAAGYVQFSFAKHAKNAASKYHKMYIVDREVAVFLVWTSMDTLSTIKVSNFPPNSSRTTLRNVFAIYGDIIDIKLIKTEANPAALVTYSRVCHAVFARKEMDRAMIGDNGILSVSLPNDDSRNVKNRHKFEFKKMSIYELQEIINSDRMENKGGYNQKRIGYKINTRFNNNGKMSYNQPQRYEDHIYTHSDSKPQQQPLTTNKTGHSHTTITCNAYNKSQGVYKTHYVIPASKAMNSTHSIQLHSNSAPPTYPTIAASTYLCSNIVDRGIMDINTIQARVNTLKAGIDALFAANRQQREMRLNQYNTTNISQSASQLNMNHMNVNGSRMNCFVGAPMNGNYQKQ